MPRLTKEVGTVLRRYLTFNSEFQFHRICAGFSPLAQTPSAKTTCVNKIIPTNGPTATRISNDSLFPDFLESEGLPNIVTIPAKAIPAVVIQRLEELPIADITIDLAYQSRITTDEKTVVQYVDLVKQGLKFPPVHVIQDPRGRLILVDGHHRLRAYQNAGREQIWAQITVGSLLDAIEFAATANTLQGLRRTNEDKRRSISMLLSHPDYTSLSDRAIADRLSVSHKLVATVRAQLENENVIAPMTTRVTKSGRSQRSAMRLERPSGESPSGENPSATNSPGKLVDALDQVSEESAVPTSTQTPTPVGIMEMLRQHKPIVGNLKLEVSWVVDVMYAQCRLSDDLDTKRIELDETDPDAQLYRAIQALLAARQAQK